MTFKKILMLLVIFSTVILFSGCAKTIAEVKIEENIGEEVSIKGTVQSSIKLGELSGYMIKDENNDEIFVSSKSLPEEGKEVKVSGILEKKPIIGYYIKIQ